MALSITHCRAEPIANARFSIQVSYRDGSGVLTNPTGPDTEFSIDGGATFNDCAEEVSPTAGHGFITLTGAEMNNEAIKVQFKGTGVLTEVVDIAPRFFPILRSSTATGGGASTITLDAGASAVDDYYNGCYVRTTGGTGGGGTGGADNQARKIIDYVGSTKVATVGRPWEVQPVGASTTFDILVPEGWDHCANQRTLLALPAAAPAATGALPTTTVWTDTRGALLDQLDNATDGTLAEIAKTCLFTLSNRTNNHDLALLLGVPDTALHTLLTDVAAGTVAGIAGTTTTLDALITSIKGTEGQDLDAIGDLVDGVVSTLADATNGLAAIKGQANKIDAAATATPAAATTGSLLDRLANKDGGKTFSQATDALEAIRDTAPMGTAMRGTDSAALASTFTGITSLADWLRGLFRKSVMEATAKTEINTGGGTFDETTDSNEAIRDTAPLGTAMRGTDGAITSLAGIATATNVSDVQTHGDSNWKTATGFELSGAAAAAIAMLNNLSAADAAYAVWHYITRGLTDEIGFALSAEAIAAIWAYAGLVLVELSPEIQMSIRGQERNLSRFYGDSKAMTIAIATSGVPMNLTGYTLDLAIDRRVHTAPGKATVQLTTPRSDITVGAGPYKTITSASQPFTAVDVGNVLNLTSGTHATPGRYSIVSVRTLGVATLGSACATGTMTDGVGYMDGGIICSAPETGTLVVSMTDSQLAALPIGTYWYTLKGVSAAGRETLLHGQWVVSAAHDPKI